MATVDADVRAPALRGAVVALRPASPGARTRYGGLVTRAIAAVIDLAAINLVALVAGGVVWLVLSLFPIAEDTQATLGVVGSGLFAVWWIVYFVGFWTTTGITPGNYAMRIRVVRVDGARLHVGRALLRLLAALVGLLLLGVGYVPILLNDRRRGLHDVLGGTVVIEWESETGR